MPLDAVVLLRPGDPFVTWWVEDPRDRRVEVDICLPPVETADGWSFVDLELDPVRHELTSVIEIEDGDEFEEARSAGYMSDADAALATATAKELAAALAANREPWGEEGWMRLRALLAAR